MVLKPVQSSRRLPGLTDILGATDPKFTGWNSCRSVEVVFDTLVKNAA